MTIHAADIVLDLPSSLHRRISAPRPTTLFALCSLFFLSCCCCSEKVTLGGIATDTDAKSSDDTSFPPFMLHVTGDDQTPLSRFVAVIRRGDTREELECPSAEGADITCTEDRIVFQDMPADLFVTIKSPGYRFVFQSWSKEELSSVEEATVSLSPLDPFETNADFATGFSPESSAEDFIALAKETGGNLGVQYIVKFYMEDIGDSPTVYFMNTKAHVLHYPFVHDVLGKTLTELEYDEQTYVDADRTAMAGTLMYFPEASVPVRGGEGLAVSPWVMTFFPSDKLTPEQAATAHRLIEERLGFGSLSGDDHRLFYLPPGELQLDALLDEQGTFTDAGIPWMKKSELYADTTLQILNEGEAYGTLHRLSADELETAIFSFRDILILTSLPNDLPLAGGTISEEFQTPLSHVNVAAMNRGTPNIALSNAGEIEEIADLIGAPVHFLVKDGTYILEAATEEEVEAFWAERLPPEVSVTADTEFSDILDLDEISFSDSIRFGAKAANVAELSKLLSNNAPHGLAVPFYYYDRFAASAQMTSRLCGDAYSDCVDEGRDPSLCESAKNLCLQNADSSLTAYIEAVIELDSFTADPALREAVLDGIAYLFNHIPVDTEFADTLNSMVLDKLGSRKVRLRSSTNAEDLPDFSGAGLYDSVSAYADVADDLPSDEIRKVWASMWSFRAFEERSFWNINHLSVHMGVLVHEAYPDEAANGVLITRNLAEPTVEGFYVNVQVGETSVTNPELGSPEIFSIIDGAALGYVQSAVYAYSSLMPEEQRVLADDEVLALYEAAVAAQERFAELYDISYWELAVFEMEFKFHGPDRLLIIKQIRPFHAGT